MAADYQNERHVKDTHRRFFSVIEASTWKADGSYRFKNTYHSSQSFVNQVWKGPDIPNWKLLLSLGLPVNTPLRGYKTETGRHSSGYAFVKLKPNYGTYDFLTTGDNLDGYDLSQPSSAISSSVSKKAASNFWSDVEKQKTTWKGGASIAEFRETVGFLASPIKGVYRESWDFVGRLGRLRKSYRKSPTNYGAAIGDAWLAYQLAVKPLFSDIHDADLALATLSSKIGWDYLPVTGSATESVDLGTDRFQVPCSYSCYYQNTRLSRSDVQYKARLQTRPPGYAGIADHFGVNLGDIIPSVWEAIPFSFVVDYFLNVGEILESLRYTRAMLDGQTVNYRNVVGSVNSDWFCVRNIAIESDHCYGGASFVHSSYVNRIPTLVPYPSWVFTIPGVGSTKWLNVAALAASFLRTSPYGKLARAVGI